MSTSKRDSMTKYSPPTSPVSRSPSHALPQIPSTPTTSMSNTEKHGIGPLETGDRHSPAEIANTYHWFETRVHKLLEAFPPLLEGDPKHPVYLNSETLRGIPAMPILFREGVEKFEQELKYRAACLSAYEAQLDQRHIRQYIHELGKEMGSCLDDMITSFQDFSVNGLPSIQSEQKRDAHYVLEISGVATFFSAVTATMLQISFTFPKTTTIIGAALNNLLATAWKRSIFGLPARMLDEWITVWLRSSPPAFLALSIWFFTLGLIIFSFASGQPVYTSTLMFLAIGVTSLGLLSVLIAIAYKVWFAPLFAHAMRLSGQGVSEQPKLFFGSSSARHHVDEDESTSDHSSENGKCKNPQKNGLDLKNLRLLRWLSQANLQTKTSLTEPARDIVTEPKKPVSSDPRSAWKRGIEAATAVQAFRQGVSHGIADLDVLASSDHFQPLKSPFLLEFPDAPKRVIPLRYGSLQDLEYSPHGQFLATTQYALSLLCVYSLL
ncbi:hypothetical protein H0H92_014207 [Tricholoma furcatifolium]|nr:hypothetical protein H0H92_014207 [Tricholoma furcatifolium]